MSTTPVQAAAGRETVLLSASPESVGSARSWLLERSAVKLGPGRVEDLLLVISEIVTNAVRHGGGAGHVELAATPKPEFLCVQVTDDGPGFVPRPGAMASEPTGGFGLFIVERLTRRWGMTREGRRTRVWFEFDYAP